LSQPLSWQTLANAPIALAEAQSTVANGKLYVFGGYNITTPDYQPTNAAEVFDPSTNTWTSLAPMPVAETHMGVATDGTNIYVAGGYTFDPQTTFQTFSTSNVFRYDIVSNTWNTYTPLPAARGAGAMVYLGGQLHFVGGVDVNRNGQTEHWVLDPSSSSPQWSTATSLAQSANHTSAVVLNGKIVVVGGQSTSDDSTTLTSVWQWDPSNPSQWTALAPMPIARSHAMVDVIDGDIVVAGGTTANDVPLASVIVYDPTTNTWTTQTSLPDGRLAPVGGAIGNQIVLATGFGSGDLQSQTWVATVS
jgi:N-acetylneuraminic acid mutarotase